MTYGEASFHHYGPRLWNSLPENLRAAETVEVFKRGLKTYFLIWHLVHLTRIFIWFIPVNSAFR